MTTLPKLQQYLIHLTSILWIIAVSVIPSSGQIDSIAHCPEDEFEFTRETESTLCQIYGELSIDLTIGAGTAYTYSSSITSPLSGNIAIIGNFIIDDDFEFSNCNVKISEGVTITVSTYNSLTIDNSNLFSCSNLWSGISLGYNTTIKTKGGTEIEDAESAIRSIYTTNVYLDIENTTFNRNYIGILFQGWENTRYSPVFVNFRKNKFTCTAPLNGTIDGIGYAGIKSNFVHIVGGGYIELDNNNFEDLIYGIHVTGYGVLIRGRRFHFERLKKDGIYLQAGSMDIRSFSFHNCEENGIQIEEANQVAIRGCSFTMDSDIPELPFRPRKYRTCLLVKSFNFNSSLTFEQSYIDINFKETVNSVKAIHLIGGKVGYGTTISIQGNTQIDICAGNSAAIYLDGIFPTSSKIFVMENKFNCSTIPDMDNCYGIECQGGSKTDMVINSNEFGPHPDGTWSYGILIQGSLGSKQIDISDNVYSEATGTFLWLYDCVNTQICNNYMYSAGTSTGLRFRNFNRNTYVSSNTFHGIGAAVYIHTGAFVGPQVHHENKWWPILIPLGGGFTLTQRSTYHALCEGCNEQMANLNRYELHTPQSVFTDGVGYTYYSEYHPENIDPDVMDEFFMQTTGDHKECGILGLDPAIDSVDILIATDSIMSFFTDPVTQRNIRRQLYRYVKDNPGLTLPSEVDSFVTAHETTLIGGFYEVNKLIDSAFYADPYLYIESKLILGETEIFLDSLYTIDSLLYLAANDSILMQLGIYKSEILDTLSVLYQTHDSLNGIYVEDRIGLLYEAYTANGALSVSLAHDLAEKLVNDIYLTSMVDQEGRVTVSQVTQLKDIAEQLVDSIGTLAAVAYSLLPLCERGEVDIVVVNDTLDQQVLVIDTTYIEELQMIDNHTAQQQWLRTDQFDIFPNPARSEIQLRFVSSLEIRSVFVRDITGRIVFSQECGDCPSGLVINTDFPPGVYLVTLSDSSGARWTRKLLISDTR
jgi:hypothetical protein